MIIVLDSGPLGMISNPGETERNEFARAWVSNLIHRGVTVVVPEICDYEVRRELLRTRKANGIARLDAMKTMLRYAAITSTVMLKAAENWAVARQQGRPGAGDDSLDGDMILAAQAWELAQSGEEVVIATTNTRHLDRFASAKLWEEIR